MKSCTIENMTVDAVIHGAIMLVPTFDGKEEYIAGEYRQPLPDAIFCGDCGNYASGDIKSESIDEIVRRHLEEE